MRVFFFFFFLNSYAHLGWQAGERAFGAWDYASVYGCVCDSSWPVGLGAGDTQEAEYFGGNCGRRRCPTGNDPRTPAADETNCNGTLAPGGYGVGKVQAACGRFFDALSCCGHPISATIPACPPNAQTHSTPRASFFFSLLLLFAPPPRVKRQPGNKCHVDCSGRGACNYQRGECDCFEGFYGENCGLMSARAAQQSRSDVAKGSP